MLTRRCRDHVLSRLLIWMRVSECELVRLETTDAKDFRLMYHGVADWGTGQNW
jgi:hypothetical protein